MPEKITSEDLLSNLVETIADSVSNKKSASFFEEEKSNSVVSGFNRLFGRERPVHHILGGGKSADVLLWRNKKISASVLAGATAIWVLFEWLNYHFLTLLCLALVLGMLAQFVWSNASGFLNRSSSQVPRLVLPDELFVSLGRSVGAEVNRGLQYLQDVACRGNLKQFLVVGSKYFPSTLPLTTYQHMLANWCNFLTVLYIGFVAAHTLPVLYERYDEQIDGFVYNIFGQLQNHYKKLDSGVLSKIPKGQFKLKKHD
ncbi:reticulon-like B 8 [Hibiscus trionum]|uniref:Reticulon-like protein n=1 Tax=Hibiscus trionum TaxID=183268 RepID=A0A9W7IBS5_HIBTR|nr:reticulon-like B 8 [Hibiscus trionum]